MSMIWWFLSLAGVVQIVVESSLFHPVREAIGRRSTFFGQMITCPMCFGVWLGGGLTLLGFGSPSMSFVAFPGWWERLGWLGSLLARLTAALLDGAALSFAAFAWTNLRGALSRPRAVAPWSSPALTRALPAPELEAVFSAPSAPQDRAPAAPPVTKDLVCSICPPEA